MSYTTFDFFPQAKKHALEIGNSKIFVQYITGDVKNSTIWIVVPDNDVTRFTYSVTESDIVYTVPEFEKYETINFEEEQQRKLFKQVQIKPVEQHKTKYYVDLLLSKFDNGHNDYIKIFYVFNNKKFTNKFIEYIYEYSYVIIRFQINQDNSKPLNFYGIINYTYVDLFEFSNFCNQHKILRHEIVYHGKTINDKLCKEKYTNNKSCDKCDKYDKNGFSLLEHCIKCSELNEEDNKIYGGFMDENIKFKPFLDIDCDTNDIDENKFKDNHFIDTIIEIGKNIVKNIIEKYKLFWCSCGGGDNCNIDPYEYVLFESCGIGNIKKRSYHLIFTNLIVDYNIIKKEVTDYLQQNKENIADLFGFKVDRVIGIFDTQVYRLKAGLRMPYVDKEGRIKRIFENRGISSKLLHEMDIYEKLIKEKKYNPLDKKINQAIITCNKKFWDLCLIGRSTHRIYIDKIENNKVVYNIDNENITDELIQKLHVEVSKYMTGLKAPKIYGNGFILKRYAPGDCLFCEDDKTKSGKKDHWTQNAYIEIYNGSYWLKCYSSLKKQFLFHDESQTITVGADGNNIVTYHKFTLSEKESLCISEEVNNHIKGLGYPIASSPTLIRLTRVDKDYCNICQCNHEKNNAFILRKYDSYKLGCYADGGKQFITLPRKVQFSKLFELNKQNTYSPDIIENAEDYKKTIKEVVANIKEEVPFITKATIIDKFESNEVKPYDFENFKTIAVRSPMGSCKTQRLKHLLESYNISEDDLNPQDKSILFLSNRKTFTWELETEFKKYKFETYLEYSKKKKEPITKPANIEQNDCYSVIIDNNEKDPNTQPRKNISKANRLIIQMDSLIKLQSDHYDLVIIDECESMFTQLKAKSMKWQIAVEKRFNDIITKSDRVIALDANFNEKSDYLLSFLRGEYKLYHNTFKPFADRKLQFTFDYELWKWMVEDSIIKGKKICIASDSATLIKKILKLKCLEGKHVVCITGEIDDVQKEKIAKNPNVEMKCDVLIYSPTITQGNSFTLKHFDLQYVYASGKSINYYQLRQMAHRIRNLNENKYIVCFHNMLLNNKIIYPESLEEIFNLSLKYADNIKAKYTEFKKEQYAYYRSINSNWKPMKTEDEDKELKKFWQFNCKESISYDLNGLLTMYEQQIQNKSRNNFALHYLAGEKSTGMQLEYIDLTIQQEIGYNNQKKIDVQKVIKEINTIVKEEKDHDLFNAKILTDEEAKDLSENDQLTKDQKLSLSKYYLMRFYKFPINLQNIGFYRDENIKHLFSLLPKVCYDGPKISKIMDTIDDLINSKEDDIICKIKNQPNEKLFQSVILTNLPFHLKKLKYSLQILQYLGFDNIYKNDIISNNVFDDNINKMRTDYLYNHIDELKNLFGSRSKITADTLVDNTRRSLLDFINSILKESFGIKINKVSNTKNADWTLHLSDNDEHEFKKNLLSEIKAYKKIIDDERKHKENIGVKPVY